jgi:hypothetical protein
MSLYARAGLDDALFSELGQNILQGGWLGAYNNTTLAKGPSFPIFLAINSMLGIPVTLSMALIYLFACYFLSQQLIKIGIKEYGALIIFIAILFHPYLLGYRITRDAVYPALVLILISGVIDLLFADLVLRKRKMFLYGLILGVFWCTREEGIWVFPAICLIILINGYVLYTNKKLLACYIKSIAYVIFGTIFFISIICTINYSYYGTFRVVDFKGSSYSRALNSLYKVKSEHEIPFLAVSKQKREILYKVSPAFSELRGYFENEGLGWTQHGCSWYPQTCGDYATGWFNWALRSAVAFKGYYASPVKADEFYYRLSYEIDQACNSGQLNCRDGGLSLLPPLTMKQLLEFPQAVMNHLKLLFLVTEISEHGGPSNQPMSLANKLRLFLGNPTSTLTRLEEVQDGPIVLQAWYLNKSDQNSWIKLICGGEDAYEEEIQKINSPDLKKNYSYLESSNARFVLKIAPSQVMDCLLTDRNGNLIFNLPEIINKEQGIVLTTNSSILGVELITLTDPMKRFKTPLKIKRTITKIYQHTLPSLTVIGIISLLVLSFRRNSRDNKLILITYMLLGLIFTRLMMLSIIEISLYKTHAAFYQTSIFPLLFLVLLLPMVKLIQNIKEKYENTNSWI